MSVHYLFHSDVVELKGGSRLVALNRIDSVLEYIDMVEATLMDFRKFLIWRMYEIGANSVIPEKVADMLNFYKDLIEKSYNELITRINIAIDTFSTVKNKEK